MAVVVFDADVVIAFLAHGDAQHTEAVERIRRSFAADTRRLICAVNYSEVLVGPLEKRGRAGAELVDDMFVRFGVETIQVDMDLARRAAAVKARTALRLPDAYALATAIHAEKRGWPNVRLESFDKKLLAAYKALHPFDADLN